MMNMNPKQIEQMMRKMGINQKELDAKKVTIELEDEILVFDNPSVSKINAMGKDTYQIVGNAEILKKGVQITEEDIKTVVEQTGCSKETAKQKLEHNEGDIAKTILELQ